jgi:hypothetical protein
MDSDSDFLNEFNDKEAQEAIIFLAAENLLEERPQHGGSRPGRAPNVDRGIQQGHERIIRDYFAPEPVYGEKVFRRRFRMRRSLFLRIVEAVEAYDTYFQLKPNALGIFGLSPIQKCTAAIRQLAYGMPADAVDEYVRIAETTTIKSLKRFCQAVIHVFGDEYLRSPNQDDVEQLLAIGEQRGFPGMLGSLDCMHWTWRNCPTAWQGQYTGKETCPTIILEAVASYDLWIWHAFFGMPGSHNDINVLDRSPLFTELQNGRAPAVTFKVNGHEYGIGYFLADGIYPSWATLVQTISQPQGVKKKHFAMMQEAVRKDVERAFGVLQARFTIVSGPARFW